MAGEGGGRLARDAATADPRGLAGQARSQAGGQSRDATRQVASSFVGSSKRTSGRRGAAGELLLRLRERPSKRKGRDSVVAAAREPARATSREKQAKRRVR